VWGKRRKERSFSLFFSLTPNPIRLDQGGKRGGKEDTAPPNDWGPRGRASQWPPPKKKNGEKGKKEGVRLRGAAGAGFSERA